MEYSNDSKNFIAYVILWQVLALAQFSILYFFEDISIANAIVDSLVFNELYLFIGISIWFSAKFISIENYDTFKLLINHVAATLFTSAVWVFLGYVIINYTIPEHIEYLHGTLVIRFILGIFFYLFLISIYFISKYYLNYKEKLLQESELNNLVKEAELTTLKYQINPHFIFNSLNSISSLTMSDPKRAQEMTIKLSNFMRSTLAKNDKQKIKLKDELKTVSNYVDIEKTRFEDKFEFVDNISGECKEIEVPHMLLQPLMENAIKHGVYESIDKVIIDLSCDISSEYLQIIIKNNFDKDAVSKKGEGIGIKNIQNRLKLIYNQDNLLTTEKEDNIFTAKIFIPLEINKSEQNENTYN